nr:glycosyltransferase [Candidatus Njordarchaeum guaymaensis]
MISVVTTVYNKEKTVSDCIGSILGQDHQDLELIIVDDESTDGSAKKIAPFVDDRRVRVVKTDHVGHSRAKNRGAEEATGSILYFIDADCVAAPNCLSQLKVLFDQPEVSCVGGELRALNKTHLIPRAIEIIQNPPSHLVGANAAYRREAFENAGRFDEGMKFGEDVDLYFRAKKLGLRCLIDSTVSVRTVHPRTVLDLLRQRFRWGIGYAQLTEKHPETVLREIHEAFALISLTVLSSFLTLLDLRLILVPLALCSVNILKFARLSRIVAKRAGKKSYWPIITLTKFLNAIAYYSGYHYWKLLELAGKKRPLKPWSPQPYGKS